MKLLPLYSTNRPKKLSNEPIVLGQVYSIQRFKQELEQLLKDHFLTYQALTWTRVHFGHAEGTTHITVTSLGKCPYMSELRFSGDLICLPKKNFWFIVDNKLRWILQQSHR